MKKIKVLHIGMSPNSGGLESFTVNMNRVLFSKVQFDYLNIYGENLAYYEENINLGSKYIDCESRKKNPFKSWKQLREIYKNGGYDFIHFHCMNYCWPEPILAKKKDVSSKLIVHSHLTGFNKDTCIKEKILHLIGKFRVKNRKYLKLACGTEAGKWLFNDDFVVIENGIDLEKYKFSNVYRNKIREKYGFKNDNIVIGHVGNFSYQKNYQYIISVFSELCKKNNNYRLLLIGDAKKAIEVKELIESKGLSKKVIFTGLICNVNEYYSCMDIFLFPSFYEGLSIAMIEAQASGITCFCSNKVDPSTNVGGNVIFIDIENLPVVAAELIESTKINRDLERLNVKIDKKYSIENAANKLLEFYIKNMKEESLNE